MSGFNLFDGQKQILVQMVKAVEKGCRPKFTIFTNSKFAGVVFEGKDGGLHEQIECDPSDLLALNEQGMIDLIDRESGTLCQRAIDAVRSNFGDPLPDKLNTNIAKPISNRMIADSENAQNQLQIKAWDADFAKLRNGSGYQWSTTLERVLDLLWKEHERSYYLSSNDSSVGVFQPQLTPRALFLVALLYGTNNDTSLRDRPDARGRTLIRIFQACGLNGARIQELLMAEFVRPMPSSRIPQDRAVVGPEFEATIERADEIRKALGRDPYIGTRHLFLALLEPTSARKTGQLVIDGADGFAVTAIVSAFRKSMSENAWAERYEDLKDWMTEVEKLEVGLQDPISTEFGKRDEWSRDAADAEVGLRVDDYAKVLREVYTNAGLGEFSLALFGHWGRGKTFLMKRLARCLKTDRYEVVFFSAWKYPTTPEVWVHLYETIADKACTGPLWTTLPRNIRTGIAKNGPWPILAALAALAFSLTPKFVLAEVVGDITASYMHIFGIGGLVWMVILASGIRRTKAKLNKDYMTATRHTEKLGLQGTIGRDLTALLVGWMPRKEHDSKMAFIAYLGLSIWIAWSALLWFGLPIATSKGLSGHEWIAATVVFLVMVGLFIWILIPLANPKRVLLVVDDLDRCSTSQLLNVVESVKLLTEEPKISMRLQVAALVDEDILSHSILSKHLDLKTSHCSKRFAEPRIIRENLEKLFTAHLRLPELDGAELTEILNLVITTDRKQRENGLRAERAKAEEKLRTAQARAAATTKKIIHPPVKPILRPAPILPDGDPGSVEEIPLTTQELLNRKRELTEATERLESIPAQPAEDPEPAREAQEEDADPIGSLMRVSFRFSRDEETAIRDAVNDLSKRGNQGPWGPRSVRGFVFRYQLARLLAIRLCAKESTPRLIADLFKEYGEPDTAKIVTRKHPKLAKLISQVA